MNRGWRLAKLSWRESGLPSQGHDPNGAFETPVGRLPGSHTFSFQVSESVADGTWMVSAIYSRLWFVT